MGLINNLIESYNLEKERKKNLEEIRQYNIKMKYLIGNIVRKYGRVDIDEYNSIKIKSHLYEYKCDGEFKNLYLVGDISENNCYEAWIDYYNVRDGRTKIWKSTGNSKIPKDLEKYLINLPELLENERKEQELKMEEERKKLEEEKARILHYTEITKHLIKAVNYLGNYEDDIIKIVRSYGTTFSSDYGNEKYLQCIDLYSKVHKCPVYHLIGDGSDGVTMYRHEEGENSWENHLMNVYTRIYNERQKRLKEEELRKERIRKKREETNRTLDLKREKERYMPLN